MGSQFSFGARRVVLVVDNNIRLSFICFGVWSAVRSFVRRPVLIDGLLSLPVRQYIYMYIHIMNSIF